MKILVTAFEAFGDSKRNSSLDTLNSLPDFIDGCQIIKVTLPVEYLRCGEILRDAVDENCVDAVLCLGQAEGRGMVTPEYCALDIMNSASPDNAGRVMKLTRITENGNGALFCAEAEKLASCLAERGFPVTLSLSAGTYVCNCLMYSALALGNERGFPAYFIHLPLSYEIAYAEHKVGRVITLPQDLLTETVCVALEIIIGGIN